MKTHRRTCRKNYLAFHISSEQASRRDTEKKVYRPDPHLSIRVRDWSSPASYGRSITDPSSPLEISKMFGNFFRTRKDKKKASARASFRPTLESLEDRAVPSSLSLYTGGQTLPSQAAGGQSYASQATQYMMQALMHANSTQLGAITTDMVAVGNAAAKVMADGSTINPTDATAYITAVTQLVGDLGSVVQSYANSTNSTSSSGLGYSLLPSSGTSGSTTPLSSSSNANPLANSPFVATTDSLIA